MLRSVVLFLYNLLEDEDDECIFIRGLKPPPIPLAVDKSRLCNEEVDSFYLCTCV